MKKLFSVVTLALLSMVLSEMAFAVDSCAQCAVQYERGKRFCDRVFLANAEKKINDYCHSEVSRNFKQCRAKHCDGIEGLDDVVLVRDGDASSQKLIEVQGPGFEKIQKVNPLYQDGFTDFLLVASPRLSGLKNTRHILIRVTSAAPLGRGYQLQATLDGRTFLLPVAIVVVEKKPKVEPRVRMVKPDPVTLVAGGDLVEIQIHGIGLERLNALRVVHHGQVISEVETFLGVGPTGELHLAKVGARPDAEPADGYELHAQLKKVWTKLPVRLQVIAPEVVKEGKPEEETDQERKEEEEMEPKDEAEQILQEKSEEDVKPESKDESEPDLAGKQQEEEAKQHDDRLHVPPLTTAKHEALPQSCQFLYPLSYGIHPPRSDYTVVYPLPASHPATWHPSIHAALDQARQLGDVNQDGIIAICVEPGSYKGGFEIEESEFDGIPIWLFSSRGKEYTNISGFLSGIQISHAITVSGSGTQPLSTLQLSDIADLPPLIEAPDLEVANVTIQGFNVSNYDFSTMLDCYEVMIPEPTGLVCEGLEADSFGGAAVLATSTFIRISNSEFNHNAYPGRGGVIATHGSRLEILSSFFNNNRTYTDNDGWSNGGVLFSTDGTWYQLPLDNRVWINRSEFGSNSSGRGGAIYTWKDEGSAELRIEDSIFQQNHVIPIDGVAGAGAIWSSGPEVSIEQTKFLDNSVCEGFSIQSCEGGGGALVTVLAPVSISGSLFRDNRTDGGEGGAAVIDYRGGQIVITDTEFSGNFAENNGGAVSFGTPSGQKPEGNALIERTQFVGNSASKGGAVFDGLASLAIRDSSFEGNNSDLNGGGIFSRGRLAIQESSFTNNQGGTTGGAIAHYAHPAKRELPANLYLQSTEFVQNRANGAKGGAVDCVLDTLLTGPRIQIVVQDSLFDSNQVSGHGGAIYTGSECDIEISGGELVGNQALFGGGMYTRNSLVNISGLTISGNTATQKGGGIAFDRYGLTCDGTISNCFDYLPDLNINDSVVSDNEAAEGGGIWVFCGDHSGLWETGHFTSLGGVFSDVQGGDSVRNGLPHSWVNFVDLVFTENRATDAGGALHTEECDLIHRRGGYYGNEVTGVGGKGGAIYVMPRAEQHLLQLAMQENKALLGRGAAIYEDFLREGIFVHSPDVYLENVLVADNVAEQGSIHLAKFQDGISTINLNFVTLAGNCLSSSGEQSAGLTCHRESSSGGDMCGKDVTSNSIIAFNQTGTDYEVEGPSMNWADDYGQLIRDWSRPNTFREFFAIYDGNPTYQPPNWLIPYEHDSPPYTNPLFIADGNTSATNLSPCDTTVYPTGSYDYHLAPDSSLIDEGDPFAGADCADGTPADIGAYGGPDGCW